MIINQFGIQLMRQASQNNNSLINKFCRAKKLKTYRKFNIVRFKKFEAANIWLKKKQHNRKARLSKKEIGQELNQIYL